LEAMTKFYAGSQELDRMKSELERAIKILGGLLERDLKRLKRPDRKNYRPKQILIECANGVWWEIARSIQRPKESGPYQYNIEIMCNHESGQLYPEGGISGTPLAHKSFDEFYRKLLSKKARIASFVRKMEALAPEELTSV
jgi:hypothetical protein